MYWCNFPLPAVISSRKGNLGGVDEVNRLCEFHDYDFRKYKGNQRLDKMARNLVDYEAGKTILQAALNIESNKIENQRDLFYCESTE